MHSNFAVDRIVARGLREQKKIYELNSSGHLRYRDRSVSKPIAEYQNDESTDPDLPAAAAVMAGDEIVVKGTNIA
jgi:hypothetical protein